MFVVQPNPNAKLPASKVKLILTSGSILIACGGNLDGADRTTDDHIRELTRFLQRFIM